MCIGEIPVTVPIIGDPILHHLSSKSSIVTPTRSSPIVGLTSALSLYPFARHSSLFCLTRISPSLHRFSRTAKESRQQHRRPVVSRHRRAPGGQREVDQYAAGVSELFWEASAIGCVLSRYPINQFHLISFVELPYFGRLVC
ncbi:hypothetical protein AAHA92_02938 [Salvia divinorum]|uniref:Uncharacterized protein n=1 Tax=Salvia divinorum TaxID=28513 RepID=A0ABD1IG39_SALDI